MQIRFNMLAALWQRLFGTQNMKSVSLILNLALASIFLLGSCLVANASNQPTENLSDKSDIPPPTIKEDSELIHSPLSLPNQPSVKSQTNKPASPARPIDLASKRRAIPTITYGMPSWAVTRPARKLASAATAPLAMPAQPLIPKADVDGVELEQRKPEPFTTLNARMLVPHNERFVDVVYAYPYPIKPPPLTGELTPLPTKDKELKSMILSAGYSDRIDFNRPYPTYGWRWVHAFYRAHTRSGLGWPRTMLTMYPWVDQMLPYVRAEVKQSNAEEADRILKHQKTVEEFEATHVDLENQATLKGLSPVAIKMNSKGIGQTTKLTPGNWWITGTRKVPGLKMFWEVPVTCTQGQIINVQFTEANAMIIQGGW